MGSQIIAAQPLTPAPAVVYLETASGTIRSTHGAARLGATTSKLRIFLRLHLPPHPVIAALAGIVVRRLRSTATYDSLLLV